MASRVPQLGPWDLVSSAKLDDLHSVVKYRSPDTGLELVHAHIEGPNVHAYCFIGGKTTKKSVDNDWPNSYSKVHFC